MVLRNCILFFIFIYINKFGFKWRIMAIWLLLFLFVYKFENLILIYENFFLLMLRNCFFFREWLRKLVIYVCLKRKRLIYLLFKKITFWIWIMLRFILYFCVFRIYYWFSFIEDIDILIIKGKNLVVIIVVFLYLFIFLFGLINVLSICFVLNVISFLVIVDDCIFIFLVFLINKRIFY